MIILIHISTPAFRMDSVSLKNTEATPNECISVWTAIYILWITMGNFYTNIGLFWTFVKAGKLEKAVKSQPLWQGTTRKTDQHITALKQCPHGNHTNGNFLRCLTNSIPIWSVH